MPSHLGEEAMAFNGQLKTETGSHKGDNDKAAPNWKRLDPQSINMKSALSGIAACSDGKVVHGDLRELIMQNRETNILQNDTLAIQQKQTETVEQTSTTTIKQGRDVMVGVYDKLQVLGDRSLWVHGHDDEHYLTRREIDEPDEKFERKHFSLEYGWTSLETLATSFETKALQTAIGSLKVEAELFEQTNAYIAGKMDAVTSKLEGFDLDIGMLLLRAEFAINALLNFARSTPIS